MYLHKDVKSIQKHIPFLFIFIYSFPLYNHNKSHFLPNLDFHMQIFLLSSIVKKSVIKYFYKKAHLMQTGCQKNPRQESPHY